MQPTRKVESSDGSGVNLETAQEEIVIPTFKTALGVWTKIGLLSFGGPAGQIAMMHKVLVEERRWIDESRFLHALNYCMLLPGPEAQQLAVYIGWLLHKTRGGIAAGLLFVLPGALTMLAISIAYVTMRELPGVEALFFGLKAAVLAVVTEAVLRIGRRALKTRLMVIVAIMAFLALFLFDVPFPYVIACAAVLGLVGGQLRPHYFPDTAQSTKQDTGRTIVEVALGSGSTHTLPGLGRALVVLGVFGVLWVTPLLAIWLVWGASSVFFQQGVFFSQTAVVTFGGAYAVLSYIAQHAVEKYGWLVPGEMLDGLGLAETTPGPLIMVVQFVSFLGAYRHPGELDPLWAGCLGAAVTVWVTFVPCFLWIFLGAPYIEALRKKRALSVALSTITAAVVGVIVNLSVWFFLNVVFQRTREIVRGPVHLLVPDLHSVDWAAAALASVALLCMLKFKLGLPKTLLFSAALGVGWRWLSAGLALAAITGCSSPPTATDEESLVPLAPLSAFAPLDAQQDPLNGHRPAAVDCNDLVGWYQEGDVLEIDTAACNYLALGAAAQVSVPEGTPISTTISHYDLTSDAAASAHIALLLNDAVLWQKTISIPASARVMEVSAPAPVAIEQGDVVSLHLHNHGQNNYQLRPLRVPVGAMTRP